MADEPGPRVLIAGEDALARAGLAALLAGAGLQVAGQHAPAELLDLPGADADALLCDVGPSGGAWLPALIERLDRPTLAVLWDESQARDAQAAGALGLLLRDADGPRLAAALAAVAQGLAVGEPALLVPPPAPRPAAVAAALPALTPRELEVLELLVQGLTNRAIAERLGISDHTAKFHVTAILSKLGAESRTEATVLAARLGLIVL
jgi:DNA-binding NarL/FixJ family response regulator